MFIKLEVYFSSNIFDYTTHKLYSHQCLSHHRRPSDRCNQKYCL